MDWLDREVFIENPHKAGGEHGGATKIKFQPWDAQRDYFRLIHSESQTITLKARQLGISWCAIIYCVWLSIFHAGVTILVFSKDLDAAKEIIRRARFVFKNLPNKPVTEPGRGDNQQEIKFSNGSRFKAFPATKNAGTSFTATFLIVDEADKMEFGHDLYTSIKPTIDDGGRIAIIFTAFESKGLGRLIWNKASDTPGSREIVRFFIPWHARPGRTREWYAKVASEAISLAYHKQEYPATAEEALAFTNLEERFIVEEATWDNLQTPDFQAAGLPCVVGLDAAVTSDNFALASVCWHPGRKIPLIRDVKLWSPDEGDIDLNAVYDEIRQYCNTRRLHRVVYDPYQLAALGQELSRRFDARAFGQNAERVQADTAFRARVQRGEVAHFGQPELRGHVMNADIKVDSHGTKLRLVKRDDDLKIDLAVASSMALFELTNEFPLRADQVPQGSPNNFSGQRTPGQRKMFDGRPSLIYDRIRR